MDHLNQAAAIYRAEHMDRNYAEMLSELGAILNETDSPDRAPEAWREALAILIDLDPHRAAQIREQLDALDRTRNT